MQPVYECEVGQDGLSNKDYEIIETELQQGGLCILPSDSAYILTGHITDASIVEDIDTILNRNRLEMSLCFNSIDQVNGMIGLTNLAYSFINKFTPGGLTFIALPTDVVYRRFAKRLYSKDGTIGIRISESKVETQLSAEFPLPSTPIRQDDNSIVKDSGIALETIALRMERLNINRRIVLIHGQVLHPGVFSTVVREKMEDGYWKIEVLRKGIIPNEEIIHAAKECFYEGVIFSS